MPVSLPSAEAASLCSIKPLEKRPLLRFRSPFADRVAEAARSACEELELDRAPIKCYRAAPLSMAGRNRIQGKGEAPKAPNQNPERIWDDPVSLSPVTAWPMVPSRV